MIKQQYIRMKIIRFALLVLEIIILSFTGLILYTTNHRMGMQRHIIYLNQKLNSLIKVDYIWILTLGALVILGLLYFIDIIRYREKTIVHLGTLALLIASLLYIYLGDLSSSKAYYFICIFLSVANVIQAIRYKIYKKIR